jgi:hypothetical protein
MHAPATCPVTLLRSGRALEVSGATGPQRAGERVAAPALASPSDARDFVSVEESRHGAQEAENVLRAAGPARPGACRGVCCVSRESNETPPGSAERPV